MPVAFRLIVGRIETLALDAIVNPANTELAPGGGADGAIRRAAGPELPRFLERFDGLAEGAAIVTPGFALPARWIIHTVAPRASKPIPPAQREDLLAQCYRSTIEAAATLDLATLAFPSIGTGALGWPIHTASAIAMREMRASASRFQCLQEITICCFSQDDAAIYQPLLSVS
jgi:O-acetyl-ADP-ribose deacetylase (regulator of RNase III)